MKKGTVYMDRKIFKYVRLYKNMTQIEFASLLGVSLATVGRIETGSLNLTSKVKAKLVSNFEFDKEFFSFVERYEKLGEI
ncbi:helix-turn-helix domain-containing protein [Bacillus wiedmannii]|uniref:helix-turn-helix domain-containing protein n=1 Tax=Bacillus wiedmannii TaxID=1890302 RepID=UPI001CB9AD4D|nr:helix-turn-helix transcriptional regulator [Bacillus wiedmannii]